MDGEQGVNGWGEWRRHVLIELESLRTSIAELKATVNNIDKRTSTDIAVLKFKSSIWGVAGGAAVLALFALVEIVKRLS